MPTDFTVQPFDLPVAGGACRLVTSTSPQLRYFVSAQPIYSPTADPYATLRAAGIRTTLCVRDPAEVADQPNPYDLTEAGQSIKAASLTSMCRCRISFRRCPRPARRRCR